ncbi:hypothetical protein VKT23_013040 [Stygiomarasmius scandens]|uniref:Uncharacterized protein n=1 Tax=Marasmiellus scandens TaxID=2682957 RepID=A0ABR1J4G7_9AGAR
MSNHNLSANDSEESTVSLNQTRANFLQYVRQRLRVYLNRVEQQDPQGPAENAAADSQADIIEQIIEQGFIGCLICDRTLRRALGGHGEGLESLCQRHCAEANDQPIPFLTGCMLCDGPVFKVLGRGMDLTNPRICRWHQEEAMQTQAEMFRLYEESRGLR